MPDSLLTLDDLAVHYMVGGAFKGGAKTLKAVDGVTLDVKPGECLGLVGESGCGKSTLALAIMGLVAPTRGRMLLDGKEISAARTLMGSGRPREGMSQPPARKRTCHWGMSDPIPAPIAAPPTPPRAAPTVLNGVPGWSMATWSSPFGETKRARFLLRHGLSFGGRVELQVVSTSKNPSRKTSAASGASAVVTLAASSDELGPPSVVATS